MTIDKEIVVLTGGSGGIGSAISKALIAANYHVYNLDIDSPSPMKNETYYPVDLLDFDKLDKVSRSLSEEKNLVGFIHCAGYGGPFRELPDIGEDQWDKVFGINIKSAYVILKNFLSPWKEKNFGRFISIASSQSIVGAKLSVTYSASKHALVGMVKSLADEWGEYGITSNAVSPGYVDTKMGIQDDKVDGHLEKVLSITPVKRVARPDEIARVVLFLLSKESGYINGANWTVDGGLTSI
ncbi:MAG: SDR family oxidoreductase [Leptospiraceae bacterium]|nr:SDR family oxidoreductase [Leptospiraceae bacterium]